MIVIRLIQACIYFFADPVGNIIENLTVKRSKAKVMEKLLEMGMVSEKKELYKKRKGGGSSRGSGNKKGKKNAWEEEEEEEAVDRDREDYEDDQAVSDVDGENISLITHWGNSA